MIDFYAICERVLQRHSDDIEALNKLQLLSGQKSDGTKLPPYSKSYLKTRKKYGRPTAPMDLYLTGKLHEAIFTTFFDKSFNIESNDYKGDILESRFGSKIYGLTNENKMKLLYEYGVAEEIITEAKEPLIKLVLNFFKI
jgi:hypothetical protein